MGRKRKSKRQKNLTTSVSNKEVNVTENISDVEFDSTRINEDDLKEDKQEFLEIIENDPSQIATTTNLSSKTIKRHDEVEFLPNDSYLKDRSIRCAINKLNTIACKLQLTENAVPAKIITESVQPTNKETTENLNEFLSDIKDIKLECPSEGGKAHESEQSNNKFDELIDELFPHGVLQFTSEINMMKSLWEEIYRPLPYFCKVWRFCILPKLQNFVYNFDDKDDFINLSSDWSKHVEEYTKSLHNEFKSTKYVPLSPELKIIQVASLNNYESKMFENVSSNPIIKCHGELEDAKDSTMEYLNSTFPRPQEIEEVLKIESKERANLNCFDPKISDQEKNIEHEDKHEVKTSPGKLEFDSAYVMEKAAYLFALNTTIQNVLLNMSTTVTLIKNAIFHYNPEDYFPQLIEYQNAYKSLDIKFEKLKCQSLCLLKNIVEDYAIDAFTDNKCSQEEHERQLAYFEEKYELAKSFMEIFNEFQKTFYILVKII